MNIPSSYVPDYSELTRRLNDEARTPVKRPIFNSLLKRKNSGEHFDRHNINGELLRHLCINELCGDKALSILFDTDKETIKALRRLYRIDLGKIYLGNALNRTLKVIVTMEDEENNTEIK